MFLISNRVIPAFLIKAFGATQFHRLGSSLTATTTTMTTMMMTQDPKHLVSYTAPSFAKHFKKVPKYRLQLANLPTPLQVIPLSNGKAATPEAGREDESVLQPFRDLNAELWIKRDDMSAGVELGGNKIRKLEFLLAEALEGDYNAVITIGGEQSNHCRATVRFDSPWDW